MLQGGLVTTVTQARDNRKYSLEKNESKNQVCAKYEANCVTQHKIGLKLYLYRPCRGGLSYLLAGFARKDVNPPTSVIHMRTRNFQSMVLVKPDV